MNTSMNASEWKAHVYRVGSNFGTYAEPPPLELVAKLRSQIEPWLAAVFQAEHLSLLLGSGFTLAVANAAKAKATGMSKVKFGCQLEDKVNAHADETAKACGRGEANIEDQFRAALELHQGLRIAGDKSAVKWQAAINTALREFLASVLTTENSLRGALTGDSPEGASARNLLTSFLLSFASRVPSRERLHVFTTNYERLIEFGGALV